MAFLHAQLEVTRCPHCQVDKPSLVLQAKHGTTDHAGRNQRHWGIYQCQRCGSVVTAASNTGTDGHVTEIYPSASKVEDALPAKAKAYLEQAINSRHAPAGAVILAASAVDAMLKERVIRTGLSTLGSIRLRRII
jgi:hypothetical protein